MDVPVELAQIIINEAIDQQVVVLRELDGNERSFPIVIGMTEILAIDRRIKEIQLPRPMTHELMENIIIVTGGQIEKVVIDNIENHTYYAKLHVNFDGKKSVIDCRPSDALALTAGLKVGLFVAEDVFQKLKL
jgi:bifunctional DNase/RNase